MKKIIPILSILILSAAVGHAQDGTLDNSFGTNGIARLAVPGMLDIWNAMALQSDGKIVTSGTYNNAGNKDFVVARFNANGTIDNTFGTGEKLPPVLPLVMTLPLAWLYKQMERLWWPAKVITEAIKM